MTAQDKNVANLRRVPRRTFDSVVGVLLHGQYTLERAFQLGEGGMMISSSRPLSVDEILVISFVINHETIAMVRGAVRTVLPANPKIGAPARFNIEFSNLEFHFKRAIRNFVAAATEAEGLAAAATVY